MSTITAALLYLIKLPRILEVSDNLYHKINCVQNIKQKKKHRERLKKQRNLNLHRSLIEQILQDCQHPTCLLRQGAKMVRMAGVLYQKPSRSLPVFHHDFPLVRIRILLRLPLLHHIVRQRLNLTPTREY
jgi:hypothetical protein